MSYLQFTFQEASVILCVCVQSAHLYLLCNRIYSLQLSLPQENVSELSAKAKDEQKRA